MASEHTLWYPGDNFNYKNKLVPTSSSLSAGRHIGSNLREESNEHLNYIEIKK